jgi:hypothetical protein
MRKVSTLMLCLLASVFWFACSPGSDSSTEDEIKAGSEAYLYQGSDTAFVAIDEESLSAFEEALQAKDKIGFAELIQSGRVLHVPANTKVLILDAGLAVKVRILEGEYTGKAVWTDSAWIKKNRTSHLAPANSSQSN